ncbi:MAG: carboxypeptidase-like regulatory domain-containing protein [Paludibacter sp.]|jgi:hypothetical protein|nr:carboxypeptidase-like regulatory domain-containing protein [Paludibacter sp.]
MKKNLLLSLVIAFGCTVFAQETETFFIISGSVRNANTKARIERVNIAAAGTDIGTISNENGEFVLKISKNLNVSEIELSCLGYFNARFSISQRNEAERIFLMQPRTIVLQELQVTAWKNPAALVQAAIERIDKNYSNVTNLFTAFYRETTQKRNKYINLSEAVMKIYKTEYTNRADLGRVEIMKGRKLISQSAKDTLGIKLLGGPNMALMLDIVKNPDILLDAEMIPFYNYKMEENVSINDNLQFVVSFKPRAQFAHPLYEGKFYINTENLAITRAEFDLDMSDKQKISDLILKTKPAGLRFTPEKLNYIVSYMPYDDRMCLNYIRADIKFKCDWRRRLFATQYTICEEMFVTDREQGKITKIPYQHAFKESQSLSNEVSTFYDADFWGAYNIISPSESLESAVKKLKNAE